MDSRSRRGLPRSDVRRSPQARPDTHVLRFAHLSCREDPLVQQGEDLLGQGDGPTIAFRQPRHRSVAPVRRVLRKDPTDAAAGIVDVAFVAWDHVEVSVRDGLAGSLAGVQADVVTIRVM